jgi:WD40 repeat protein
MNALRMKEAEALNDRGAYTSRLINVSNGEEVIRIRHESPVQHVVFSPVSNLLVAADQNHLLLIDIASKAELARLEIEARRIAFSLNGRILVVTHSYPEEIGIFDALTGDKINGFEQKGVWEISFSPDSRYFLARGIDDARIIEAATGRELLRGGTSITRFQPKNVENVSANCQASDEQVFASAAGDRLILRGVDGRERYQKELHAPITAITFSPDGCFLAVGTGGGFQDKLFAEREASHDTLWLFEAATGRELFRNKHEYAIERLAFRPDSRLLVTSEGQLGRVVMHYIAVPQGRYIGRMEHPGELADLDFVQNGRIIVTRSPTGSIQFIDPLGGRDVTRIDHGGEIGHLSFSNDGRYMATQSAGGRAKLIELESGREVTRIKPGKGISPSAVGFSPDSQFLVVGDGEGSLRKIETSTGHETVLTKHGSRIDHLAFSSDGSMLAFSVEEDNLAVVVEPATGREITRIPLDEQCYGIEFSSDSRLLAIASQDKTVRIIEVASGHLVARIEHGDSVLSSDLAFSPDGQFLATNTRKDPTRLFQAVSGHEIVRIEQDSRSLAKFAFSPDGRSLAASGKDNVMLLLSTETGHEFARIEHGGRIITRIVFSPDSRFLTTTSSVPSENLTTTSKDSIVRIIEAASGRNIAQFKYDGEVSAIAFSPDSRLLGTGSTDGAVRLIEPASGREIARIEHGGPVRALTFSPNGRFLATGSENKMALVLRTEQGQEGREVARVEHGGRVWWVGFSPDSRVLVTFSEIGVVRVIRPDPEYVFDLLCHRAGQNLSRAEWNTYIGPTESWRPTCANWHNPEETQASAN